MTIVRKTLDLWVGAEYDHHLIGGWFREDIEVSQLLCA